MLDSGFGPGEMEGMERDFGRSGEDTRKEWVGSQPDCPGVDDLGRSR